MLDYCSQSGANLEPIWSQSGASLEPIWSQSGANLEPIWSQSGAYHRVKHLSGAEL